MLPAPADRLAVKLVAEPVLPVRPSAESALPVPMIDRSEFVPVLICSAPLAAIVDAVPTVVIVAVPPEFDAVLTPVFQCGRCDVCRSAPVAKHEG